jgi:hypothetical protein
MTEQETLATLKVDMVRRYAHLSSEHLAEYAGRIEIPFRTLSGTP